MTTLDLITTHQLDVHFHQKREKVSVWHPDLLERATVLYMDHNGDKSAALDEAVRRCVQLIKGFKE